MKKSHKQMILEHLKAHGCITAAEAVSRFKCYRLTARISDLKADGYNIITENEDAEGNKVNYAIYRLKEVA